MRRLLVLVVAIGLPIAAVSIRGQSTTRAEFARWKTELSNWGRWGKDDQMGALNLITPAKRRQAAALVREGISVSLSRDADMQKAIDNPDPFEHSMIAIGADRVGVIPHGVAHTHLDSLAHIHYDGVFYNGYKPDEKAVMKSGHTRNSIINLKNGIFTRGILVDLPLLKGVPYLEPGTPITAQDMEAWEKFANVKIGAGDALFLRTGRWARRAKLGPFDTNRTAQPIGTECVDDSVAETTRRRAAWRRHAAQPRADGCRGRDRAPSTTSRSSISACTSSTTAISKRWQPRRRRGSGGSSC